MGKLESLNLKKLVGILLAGFLSAEVCWSAQSSVPEAKPKVLFVLTSHDEIKTKGTKTGFWLSELTHPFFEFTNNGVDTDIVSIGGGDAPIEPRSLKLEDPENKKFMAEHKKRLKNLRRLSSVDAKNYKAIYFVGGHGAMWDFVDSKIVSSVALAIYDNSGVVAAVCHGPAAFASIQKPDGVYLVKGKKVAGFSNDEEKAIQHEKHVPFLLEDKLKQIGGIYSKASVFQAHVVVDQRIVSGQNPASAKAVAKEVLKLIQPKEAL